MDHADGSPDPLPTDLLASLLGAIFPEAVRQLRVNRDGSVDAREGWSGPWVRQTPPQDPTWRERDQYQKATYDAAFLADLGIVWTADLMDKGGRS